ncbi:MAG: hypothetical protein HMLIMOIP_002665 [Candidatus Nitrosomirales archaeon]|jgi:hypothetical protein
MTNSEAAVVIAAIVAVVILIVCGGYLAVAILMDSNASTPSSTSYDWQYNETTSNIYK